MNHFKERRPRWALLDEERGELVAFAFPVGVVQRGTGLFATKREALAARFAHAPGTRVVKLEVQYERCL
jgi:hypothetical protein